VTIRTYAITVLTALTVLFGAGCGPVRSTSSAQAPMAPELPDTRPQLALVRQYVDLIAAERYTDAWQLISPVRQVLEPPEAFTANWRAWGHVGPEREGFPFLWAADVNQVRADLWLQDSTGSVSLQRVAFDLVQADGAWRVLDEHGRGHHERTETSTIASVPVEVARGYVAVNYGPMWLQTLEVLAQEPFEGGQVVVFRVLSPSLDRKSEATPAAILLYARTQSGGWVMAGGGGIGTVAEETLSWRPLRGPTSKAMSLTSARSCSRTPGTCRSTGQLSSHARYGSTTRTDACSRSPPRRSAASGHE
jgi:hypothetical protein